MANENEKVRLTSKDLSQMQNDKEMYCVLRIMNFVEKFYSTDKIDQPTYSAEIDKLLSKYNKFSHIIPNYSLNDFIAKYRIPHQEIQWAKYVIEKGADGKQDKETVLFIQATATFIEAIEALSYTVKDPVLSELRPSLEKLQTILRKIQAKLGIDFSNKFSEYCKLLEKYVATRSINDSIAASQAKELLFNVQGMYHMMQDILRN